MFVLSLHFPNLQVNPLQRYAQLEGSLGEMRDADC